MLSLPQVTLCCVDTINHDLAWRAIQRSTEQIQFGRTLFISDRVPNNVVARREVEHVAIPPLRSTAEYSQFLLKDMLHYVSTSHVLIVQWDGYVVRPTAWDDAFLEWDYIGATWPNADTSRNVGNGGFSLRSRKLLNALTDQGIQLQGEEDTTICDVFRPRLENEYGIRFATDIVADRFSFELKFTGLPTFGFHGLFNLPLVESHAELLRMAPTFPARLVQSQHFEALTNNCLAYKQWQVVTAFAKRMLALDPSRPEAIRLLAAASSSKEN